MKKYALLFACIVLGACTQPNSVIPASAAKLSASIPVDGLVTFSQ